MSRIIDRTFWKRLKSFVQNIEVNDQMGYEEKEYILGMADDLIHQESEVNKSSSKDKLYQIDNILMRLEDCTHGKDGDDITVARKNIIELLSAIDKAEKVKERNKEADVVNCEHPPSFITSKNGYIWCTKCGQDM